MIPLAIPVLLLLVAAGVFLSKRGDAPKKDDTSTKEKDSGTTPPPAPGTTPPAPPAPATPDAPSVAACRAAVPVEPGLTKTSALLGGHIYSGNDAAHVAYLKAYLDAKANAASGETRRAILAFKALQGREGSTAAMNTYDNQIVTWGTGFGGVGLLPLVMDRLVAASPEVVKQLAACGVKYTGSGKWAVDDGTGKIVEGSKPALQVIRATPALMNLLIHLAKDPATRDAVTDAQLGTFVATSGKFAASEQLATQALFTFASHLKHWAPGYLAPPGKKNAVETAAAAVPGAPSADRDKQLAPAVVTAYYANAPVNAYIAGSGWKQLQKYVRDMREDGLDVVSDPVLSASSPPPSAQAMA